MKKKKKESIKDRIAEAVEMELAQAKSIGWSEEGRRLDDKLEKELNQQETTTAEDEGPEQELDFDRHDFGTITEDEE